MMSSQNYVVLATIAGEFVGQLCGSLEYATPAACFDDTGAITVEKCRLIIQSDQGVQFYPAASLCSNPDKPVAFNREHVAFVAPLSKDMEDYYIQNVSGIQLATGKLDK